MDCRRKGPVLEASKIAALIPGLHLQANQTVASLAVNAGLKPGAKKLTGPMAL